MGTSTWRQGRGARRRYEMWKSLRADWDRDKDWAVKKIRGKKNAYNSDWVSLEVGNAQELASVNFCGTAVAALQNCPRGSKQ